MMQTLAFTFMLNMASYYQRYFKVFLVSTQVDTQANLVRKVQRSNDELQETVENLQVQLNHTESR